MSRLRLAILGNKKGFTLLEILIVLVIIAVLAGLAVPAYQAAVEKSRGQEALQGLTAARSAMLRYWTVGSTYVGAAFGVGNMDYNPNTVVGGQTLIFTYALSNLGATTFTITATRQGGPVGTITLNEAGTVGRTGVYA